MEIQVHATMPKYHVFSEGVLTQPNDLASMKAATERFNAEKASLTSLRGLVTLTNTRGKRLRVFHADRQPRNRRKPQLPLAA